MSMARYRSIAVAVLRGPAPAGRSGIQCAKTAVAVGLERAHAQLLGQGEGLLVVGFGLRGIGGIGVSIDGAKLVQRERLVPPVLELPGQVERLARVLPGLLATSHKTTDLAEPGDPAGMIAHLTPCGYLPDALLQQRAPLGEAPLEGIGIAQARDGRS